MSADISQDTIPQLFGRRVREVRERRGWSQGELAERVTIDRTTLNKIERGSRGDVSLTQMFAFALALEISPLYLITPTGADDPVLVTNNREPMAAADLRAWIRGGLLPGQDATEAFLDLPRDEQRSVLQTAAAAQTSPLARAAAGISIEELVSEEDIDELIAALEKASQARRRPAKRTKRRSPNSDTKGN